jgi:hypothetical protein
VTACLNPEGVVFLSPGSHASCAPWVAYAREMCRMFTQGARRRENQMGTKEWKSILARLEIEQGAVNPVKKSVLSKYEKEAGLILPKSYKAYCQTFGPGELAPPWTYRIHTPHALSTAFNIDILNQKVKGMTFANLSALDMVRFKRVMYFATDMATSDFFWDPEDVTDKRDNECGIYVMYRNWRVERLCDTFWAFINDICLGTGVPGYDNSEGVELVFSPMK